MACSCPCVPAPTTRDSATVTVYAPWAEVLRAPELQLAFAGAALDAALKAANKAPSRQPVPGVAEAVKAQQVRTEARLRDPQLQQEAARAESEARAQAVRLGLPSAEAQGIGSNVRMAVMRAWAEDGDDDEHSSRDSRGLIKTVDSRSTATSSPGK